MQGFFSSNIKYKLLALALALLFWVNVAQIQNPVTEEVYNVPLETANLSGSLVVTEQSSQIQVRLSGQRQLLNTVEAKDIRAYCDLTDCGAGEHTLTIFVTVPTGTQLVSASPGEVTLKLEDITSRTFPIATQVTATADNDEYLALDPVLSPETVVIYGAASVLDTINKVYVNVDISNYAAGSFTSQLPIKLISTMGDSVYSGIELSPEVVSVFVPIVSQLPSKSVVVKVNTKGEVAGGYQLVRVICQPNFLDVYGNYADLQPLDYLQSEVIDISGARSSITVDAKVSVPAGLQLGGVNAVKVLLDIEQMTEKTFSLKEIAKQNISSGLQAQIDSREVNVRLSGPRSVIDGIDEGDVAAYVDCEGLAAGHYSLNIKVSCPALCSVVFISPESVVVAIGNE